MKSSSMVIFFLCCVLCVPSVFAEERVVGSKIISQQSSNEESWLSVIALPLTHSELDLFFANFDAIERWAKAHQKEWSAANSHEHVRQFGVWKKVDMTADEWIALVIKLLQAQYVAKGGLDVAVAEAKKTVQDSESLLQDPDLPEENKQEIKTALSNLKEMITKSENYPSENLRIYEANKAKIDDAFVRLYRIGKTKEGKGQ